MQNNTAVSTASTRLFEIIKGFFFGTFFVLLGLTRIARAVAGWFLDLFLRLSLALFVYAFIGIIIAAAMILVVGYYLLVLSGSQFRLS